MMPVAEMLDIYEVELDLSNPRISNYLENYSEISSEGIALALSSSEEAGGVSYSALKKSIYTNGGIINPIIVSKNSSGKMTVVEGNTRLQIYREFNESEPGKWSKISAMVYENLEPETVHSIRLQAHLVGPRDWEPYSKARYIFKLSEEEKMSMARISELCGGKSAELTKLLDAYKDVKQFFIPILEENGEMMDPREFSKFVELQNQKIARALVLQKYEKKHFAQWVFDGKISKAQDVRELPDIFASSKAKSKFLKTNTAEAIKELAKGDDKKNASFFDLVTLLTEEIRSISYYEVKSLLENSNRKEDREKLLNLKEQLDDLVDSIF